EGVGGGGAGAGGQSVERAGEGGARQEPLQQGRQGEQRFEVQAEEVCGKEAAREAPAVPDVPYDLLEEGRVIGGQQQGVGPAKQRAAVTFGRGGGRRQR